jgi:hypothetical protein
MYAAPRRRQKPGLRQPCKRRRVLPQELRHNHRHHHLLTKNHFFLLLLIKRISLTREGF